MIRDIVYSVLLLLVIGGIHAGLSSFTTIIRLDEKSYLSYAVLFILAVIGSSVFVLEKRMKNIEFPQAFMIVTVVQLLGVMSYVTYLRYTLTDHLKTNMLQFVVIFLIFLAVQSVYLIKTKAQER